MSPATDKNYLEDIYEAIKRIQDYTKNMILEEFMSDFKTQDAVIRNIEIIGEATKNLSEKLRDDNPHVPWRNISRTRDKLIHHYFGVNLDIVWEIIEYNLSELLIQVEELLANYKNG